MKGGAVEIKEKITHTLLKLFAQIPAKDEYLQAVNQYLANLTQCHHTGVRILNQDGIVLFGSSVGLNDDFLAQENCLAIQDDYCICTRIYQDRQNLSDLQAYLSDFGSFYCNNTVEFFRALTVNEGAKYRGTCIRQGFKSLAVIPIRYRGSIVGSILIADDAPNQVPLTKVELIESITPIIDDAIYRFNVEEQLHRNYETQTIIDQVLRLSLGEISRHKGILYDADVVDACLRLFNNQFTFDQS